jgi:hypothetical protein
MESSKYLLCTWKWWGPRYIPSDQTTLERYFIRSIRWAKLGFTTRMGAVHSFSAVMQNILYHSNLEPLEAVVRMS